MAEEITAEEIAHHYRSAMDSVNLINEIVASGDTDEESVDTLKRNKDHLKIWLIRIIGLQKIYNHLKML